MMSSMGKAIGCSLFAIIAAIAGFFLRTWELNTMYDKTGLPNAFSQVPAGLALLGVTLATAIVLFVLCRGRHRRFKNGFYEAFAAPHPVYLIGIVAAAGSLFCSAVFAVQSYLSANKLNQTPSVLSLVLAALTVVAAVGIVISGLRNFKGNYSKRYSAALLAPAYACCLWLVAAYRIRSADPMIIEYVYVMLAIGSALLALYFISSFSFDRPKVGRTAFFSLLTLYLIGVTLADGHDIQNLLMFVGYGLYLLISVVVLLKNDAGAPKRLSGQESKETAAESDGAALLDTEVPENE
jgi:TRAP-type C4-dicarboxylate transport system permease small subunit